jgi:hypothetical protein
LAALFEDAFVQDLKLFGCVQDLRSHILSPQKDHIVRCDGFNYVRNSIWRRYPPIFIHQYGVTTWYKLLMYCVYGNRRWSPECIFITDTKLVVVRIDPISPEIDQNTQYILDHLKWAIEMGPRREIYTDAAEDVLIDITTTPSQDIQSCGLRVLQYHQIIGKTIEQHPTILEGDQATLQEFLLTVILPQLRTVNMESNCQELCTAMLSLAWETGLKHPRTWLECVTAGIKRKTKATQASRDTNPSVDRPIKMSRQLYLWEQHPRKEDEQAENVDLPHVMDEDASPPQSNREEERQLQWIHRWMEESTLEALPTQRQKEALRGSSII